MGVPALFRWLSRKYPKIISPVIEEQPPEVDGATIPVDTTKPNPNGVEYDNLYLDMNGIVHPCSHPEDRPPPATEEEMMLEVFKYTDRVVNMVRPRKLLLIAVDGVAPRAKMNQQRSRRFRTVQEAKEKDEDKAKLMQMLRLQKGEEWWNDREKEADKKTWDSNAITPGTPFMFKLAESLRYWCAYKLNTDPGWADVKVIISDASVPGEGEHKIMEFIRSQRSSQFHDPNTRHVIYGLDADLIMLGLATHEPHFHVLREDVFFQETRGRACQLCGQKGHRAEECTGKAKQKEGDFDEKSGAVALKPFIWLHVSILREYLQVELHVPGISFPFDLERAIDDWVFMCFFVGNDFLPHLPSLDIRENGIDTLIAIWRDNLPLMNGYATKDGQVDLARVQYIMDGLAKQEDAIFRRRKDIDDRKEAGAKRRKLEEDRRNNNGNRRSSNRKSPDYSPYGGSLGKKDGLVLPTDLPVFDPSQKHSSKDMKQLSHDMVMNRSAMYKANEANKSAAAVLKSKLQGENGTSATNASEPATPNGGSSQQDDTTASVLGKRKADEIEGEAATPNGSQAPQKGDDEPPPDTVRLWEPGYADRYYEQKFGADPQDIAFRNEVARSYVEGLAWVLLYYFQGCPSWTWYYPYHYAPFAADFVDLAKQDLKFNQGKPFRPYEQLMGVLPIASNHVIPEAFRSLMSDPESDIVDFYPEEFKIDLNGKKMAWQGVALLPFIDEKRLLDAMATRYPQLSADEVERNAFGKDVLIFSDKHSLYDSAASNFYSKKKGEDVFELESRLSKGLMGKIEKDHTYLPLSELLFPFDTATMPNLDEDHSMSVFFHIPKSKHIHKSMLLRGVRFDRPVLDNHDIEETKKQARGSGRSHGGAPLRGSNRNSFDRGGRMDYGAKDRGNPFAAHLPQGYMPPPHIAGRGGGDFRRPPQQGGPPPGPPCGHPPPMPPHYRNGPPPPPPQHRGPPPPMGYPPYQGQQQQHYAPPPPQGYNSYGRGGPPPQNQQYWPPRY